MRHPTRDNSDALAAHGVARFAADRALTRPRLLRPPRYARRGEPRGGDGSPAVRAIAALVVAFVLMLLVFLLSLASRPAISDLSPMPNSQTPPGPVSIRATVTSNAQPIRRVIMTLDGAVVEPAVSVRNDHVWVVNFTAVLSRGKHDVRVEMIDTAGQRESHAWSFTAAGPRVAPTLTFSGPLRGESVPSGDVHIAVQVISDGDIVRAEMQVNDQRVPTFLSPDPRQGTATSAADGTARSWTLFAEPTLDPGSYTARITVEDVYGSTSNEVLQFSVVADPAQATARFVPETGQYVRNPFKAFWEAHDGPALFGRPVSPEFVDERGITVQYFERARLEEAGGEVVLGLLGVEALGERTGPVEDPHNPAVRYFPETGHTLAGKFREFWEQRGGIAIFGFPITEELDEGGLRVQYFERVRLELRATSEGTEMEVAITPLGQHLWEARGSS